jgi:hypothetical protein
LDLAQRAFCAAAILARPAALIFRRFGALASKSAGLKLVALLLPGAGVGRPGLRFALPPRLSVLRASESHRLSTRLVQC